MKNWITILALILCITGINNCSGNQTGDSDQASDEISQQQNDTQGDSDADNQDTTQDDEDGSDTPGGGGIVPNEGDEGGCNVCSETCPYACPAWW